MRHQNIAGLLRTRHDLPPWRSQMVAVNYERARGIREKHQTARGYEVSVSSTLPLGVSDLYAAWDDPQLRDGWLGESSLTVRRANPAKALRLIWTSDATNVAVRFYAKRDAKSQVVVQHSMLADRHEVEAKRSYWKAALERLAARLGQRSERRGSRGAAVAMVGRHPSRTGRFVMGFSVEG